MSTQDTEQLIQDLSNTPLEPQPGIYERVEEALALYKAKHIDADPGILEAMGRNIRWGMLKSSQKEEHLNSKVNRAERRAVLNAKADELGIRFVTLAEEVKVPMEIGPLVTPLLRKSIYLGLITGELLNIAPPLKTITRSITTAVRVEEIPAIGVYLHFAMAFQNPEDSYDRLIGKELALARFTADITDEVVMSAGQYRKLGFHTAVQETIGSESVIAEYRLLYL